MGFLPEEGVIDDSFAPPPYKGLLDDIEETNPERVLEIDGDYIKFASAAAGESRDILVSHVDDDEFEPLEFKSRTAFWGRAKAIGGYLEGVNNGRYAKGLDPYTREDFKIEDRQHPEPIENVLHTVKMMLRGVLKDMGTHSYNLYIGKGDSQRIAQSTMIPYKGQREGTVKPIHLGAVHDYMVSHLGAMEVKGDNAPEGNYVNSIPMEVDDWVIICAYNKPNHIVVHIDKDARAQPVMAYNPDKGQEGIIDCTGFGRLWRDSKGKVRGYGMKFLLWQTCSGDSTDNYKANSLSAKKWGDVAAYKELEGCVDHKELFTAAMGVFKKLYPEPIESTTWQGNTFTLDWKYAFTELFNMARMLRWEGDEVDVIEVLDKLEIEYE